MNFSGTACIKLTLTLPQCLIVDFHDSHGDTEVPFTRPLGRLLKQQLQSSLVDAWITARTLQVKNQSNHSNNEASGKITVNVIKNTVSYSFTVYFFVNSFSRQL